MKRWKQPPLDPFLLGFIFNFKKFQAQTLPGAQTDRVRPCTKDGSNLLVFTKAWNSLGLGRRCSVWLFAQKIRPSERSHARPHTHALRGVSWEKEMEEKIFFSARLIDYKVNFIWGQPLVLNAFVTCLEGNRWHAQNSHAAGRSATRGRAKFYNVVLTNSRQGSVSTAAFLFRSTGHVTPSADISRDC